MLPRAPQRPGAESGAVRFRPAGPAAVLVEVEDLGQVLSLQAEIERRRADGWAPSLVDVVAGARTILLDGVDDPAGVARDLRSWSVPAVPPHVGPVIEIACSYRGPDLEEIAKQWKVSVPEAVQIHSAALHQVAFCGFGPGFAYLTGIGEQRTVARRDSPRKIIPAGSVALGGVYTGIYPWPSPGGWQLMGHTDAPLWDPGRQPAALLSPGRRVRFVDAGP
jgi:KipI family sensor histidine kinase inhibitor